MSIDEIANGCIYEVKMTGARKAPLVVRDTLPHGMLCENLDTGREVFIKNEAVPQRFLSQITDMPAYRLAHGERNF